jgi:SAM-dependent methyltransferase
MNPFKSALLKTLVKSKFIPLLKYKRIRFWVAKNRYYNNKSMMNIKSNNSSEISPDTISYNLSAFNSDAVFGCGERMGLLIYPIVSYYSHYLIKKAAKKILIVGCRSEDDILWMKSYGFEQTSGFDLFSYSEYITVGDIHETDFSDDSFDVVLLGWMISYTRNPASVFKECRRILKTGGLFGIGLDHMPDQDNTSIENGLALRANILNSTQDIISLLDLTMNHKVLFEYDHYEENDESTAVITVCR